MDSKRHATFLGGNRLANVPGHSHPLFIVAESGFGTGLNFLTLCGRRLTAFVLRATSDAARLHFISFEIPVNARRSGAGAPALAGARAWAEQLQARPALPLPGCHRYCWIGSGDAGFVVWRY